MANPFIPFVSLCPPAHEDADLADGPRPSWVLLDFRGYLADPRNATTATCRTRGKEIQVTFFPSHPPRVSYFCVHCSGVEPTGYAEEPKVVATDGKFVLLRIAIGHHSAVMYHSDHDYYIYCADGGSNGEPSLELLPNPSPYNFLDDQVGLLSRGTGFIIAALRDDSYAFYRPPGPGQYEICLLNSEDMVWTAKDVFVPPDQQQYGDSEAGFWHDTSKVIAIGGEHGTMAFVDLWRGIILCDVLHGEPMLRYVSMPQQVRPDSRSNGSPWISRDITVIQGRIKFVQILMKIRPKGTGFYRDFFSDGWVASTWSRKATFLEEDSWCRDCKIEASDIKGDNNPMHFELMQRLPEDEGKPRLTLENLHIGHPTLSLDNEDIVCFMAKVDQWETKAWIISVDMRLRMLKGVAEFGAERTIGFSYTYTQSRISKFLVMAPGTKGDLKRPGLPLPGTCSKKLSGISSAADVEAEEEDMI